MGPKGKSGSGIVPLVPPGCHLHDTGGKTGAGMVIQVPILSHSRRPKGTSLSAGNYSLLFSGSHQLSEALVSQAMLMGCPGCSEAAHLVISLILTMRVITLIS